MKLYISNEYGIIRTSGIKIMKSSERHLKLVVIPVHVENSLFILKKMFHFTLVDKQIYIDTPHLSCAYAQ